MLDVYNVYSAEKAMELLRAQRVTPDLSASAWEVNKLLIYQIIDKSFVTVEVAENGEMFLSDRIFPFDYPNTQTMLDKYGYILQEGYVDNLFNLLTAEEVDNEMRKRVRLGRTKCRPAPEWVEEE